MYNQLVFILNSFESMGSNTVKDNIGRTHSNLCFKSFVVTPFATE